jgi:CYTH domain-containing protein
VPIEIERKFLVKSDEWRKQALRQERLCQGYLSPNDHALKAEVRIRRSGARGFLTIKGKGGIVRAEFEYEIPADHADLILRDFCRPFLIEKTRYQVEVAGVSWSVDEFSGRNEGLVLAEVELQDAHQVLEIPVWIGKEVTENSAYRNANLAANPGSWRLHEGP